jgi:hypothetical protein
VGKLGQRFQSTFARRMKQIGTTATVTKKTTGAYSPTTGTVAQSTEDVEVKGVFDKARNRREEGTEVRVRELIFLAPAVALNGALLTFEPKAQYSVTIAGQGYNVSYAEPEYADDEIVYHRLYLENA